MRWQWRHRARQCQEKLLTFIAWRLPRSLVYWCFIRLWAHGTTGQWGNTHPGEMTFEQASKRWGEP